MNVREQFKLCRPHRDRLIDRNHLDSFFAYKSFFESSETEVGPSFLSHVNRFQNRDRWNKDRAVFCEKDPSAHFGEFRISLKKTIPGRAYR